MDIIILGAIPHERIAKESVAYLKEKAPHFTHLLETHQAHRQFLDIETLGCSPEDYYRLQKAGYPINRGFIANGLGALQYPTHFNTISPSKPIYLLELTSIEIAQHHARLYTHKELAISSQEAKDFFQSAQDFLKESPYQIQQFDDHVAHIELLEPHEDFHFYSPSLLATAHIDEWLRQHPLPRPWRHWLHALEMHWYQHPLNQAREHQGKKPINSVCLYGGASLSDFNVPPSSTEDYFVHDLAYAHRHEDWGLWLDQLTRVDHQLKQLLSGQHRFILLGFDQLVTLTPQPWFKRFFQQDWQLWWSAST